jgi:hypothetical protein
MTKLPPTIDPDKTLEHIRAVDDLDVLESYDIGGTEPSIAPFAIDRFDRNVKTLKRDRDFAPESTTLIVEMKAFARRQKFMPVVFGVVGLAVVILMIGIARRGRSDPSADKTGTSTNVIANASPPAAAAPVVAQRPYHDEEDIPPVLPVASNSDPAANADVPLISLDSLPRVDLNRSSSTYLATTSGRRSRPIAMPDNAHGRVVSPGKSTVFVDGKRVAAPATVTCGKHSLKVVAMGARAREVDVPCGGIVSVR